MKKIMGVIRMFILSVCILGFMIIGFFGAVLKESYQLSPLTAEEIAEVAK